MVTLFVVERSVLSSALPRHVDHDDGGAIYVAQTARFGLAVDGQHEEVVQLDR